MLPPDRATFWLDEHSRRIQSEAQWTKDREELDQHLATALGPSFGMIRPFRYLADIAELQLRNRTAVAEGVGAELLRTAVATRITPKLNHLQTKLLELRKSDDAASLRPAATTLYTSRAEIAELTSTPPIRVSYTFAPPGSAYDTHPSARGDFVLHDWEAALRSVHEIEKRIIAADRDAEVRRFLTPRDPRSQVSLVLQIAFLLIAIAGYIVSFAEQPKLAVIASIVAGSMLLSLALVFYSDDTLLNLLVQSLLPGGFILWWAWKKRRQARTV